MNKILGILVSSDRHMDKILEICRAAKKKRVEVRIFLTHKGLLLTQDARLAELKTLARIALCKVGFESYGLDRPAVLSEEEVYSSQVWHGNMIKACDRYLSF